jgi:hypothetical protein
MKQRIIAEEQRHPDEVIALIERRIEQLPDFRQFPFLSRNSATMGRWSEASESTIADETVQRPGPARM